MKDQKLPRGLKTALKRTDAALRASKRSSGSLGDVEDETTLKEQLDLLLKKGRARFIHAADAWQKNRTAAVNDLKFYMGDQWDQNITAAGRVNKEPTLTVNRLPQFIKQVENELRRQQISINVYPTDEIGSEETADIFAGLIRDIERKSHATSAYIHAAGEAGAMVPGFGFLKLTTVFADKGGFNQEIRIESPADPFKILPDPDALEADSSDAQYWFEFEDYSKEAYIAAWPESELVTLDLASPGAGMTRWAGPNGIRVIKYWYKEEVEALEYLLEDGRIINNVGWYNPNEEPEELENARQPFPTKPGKEPDIDEPVAVLRTRTIIETKIKYAILNGVEVLDQGEWADDKFPFVSIYGPTLIVDGVRDIHGIIRHAKDAQQMLNYMASSAVRRIGSANKAPWIVDVKSIPKDLQEMWKTANTKNWSALFYNSTDPDNPQRVLNPPQRADQTGQINDLLAAAQKFENDLKSCLGIYDAGLGATPNEQSGVAIKTLAEQGKNANFHFSDALAHGIQRLGYLLLCLIPKVYDTPRAVRIIGADTTEKLVRINQTFMEGGEQREYNLLSGSYGVAVSAGPAYATRKQQALDGIIRLAAADPAILPIIQDLIVGEMDFDKAPIIQERLKKLLAMKFPQLIEQDTGQKSLPPQVTAAMGQMSTAIQALTEQLQKAEQVIQEFQLEKATKQVEHAHELQVIDAKLKADLMVEHAKMERDERLSNNKLEAESIKTQLDHQERVQERVLDLAREGHLDDLRNPPLNPNRAEEPRF